jgi:hypothetical protein
LLAGTMVTDSYLPFDVTMRAQLPVPRLNQKVVKPLVRVGSYPRACKPPSA